MSKYRSDNPTPEQIAALQGPVVLEFGTDWCGHCQAAQRWVDTALAAHSTVHHLRAEDGKGRRLGRAFGVKLWPTLVFLHNGQEVARVVRPARAEDLQDALQSLIQKIHAGTEK